MTNPTYQTVIVGGGFTGLFTALHLSHNHYPRSVILIDRSERFCFKPLLYEYFSGEMKPDQVVPRYENLLKQSGVIFVQDSVQNIDLQQRQVQLAGGDVYRYSNLVLGLGSTTGYFGVEGAEQNALPFRTQEDAIAIDRHLRDCLDRAVQLSDPGQRRTLLTTVVVGGGPSGVEMAATLADVLPHWYEAVGGSPQEIRVVLVNHGELLKGDINSTLRETAEQELKQRSTAVEIILGAEVKAIHPGSLEYQRNHQTEVLRAGTVIWTTGTNTHPLIKALPIPDEHRDKHGRLNVTPTLQLPDFPEVFAGGDCAIDFQPSVSGSGDEYEPSEHQTDQSTSAEDHHPDPKPLPPTAQVAYQQGATIAHNLKAIALGDELKPAQVNLRGTLLKLGLDNAVANLFNKVPITGETGHLIRQGTYLELLPTPIHNFNATAEWIQEELFEQDFRLLKQAATVAGVVGGIAVGAIAARKLLHTLSHESTGDKR
ncbi:NAD(P)/FAD-dependent oxidoreductase [Pseudanabaenaceae cyanobacterium LEGE 13415]|nr:NAD(P)/FAD-dependent oxidoreductase [Pseudanabaenaceae cyanobacterium LEGE 13415]